MPPRRNRFDDDPYYSIYRQMNTNPDTGNLRPGFLQHREISQEYEVNMDMDRRERMQFWADYNHYLIQRHTSFKRNDPEHNPFWTKYNINPDRNFDWRAWREAMGYPHGNRR